MLVELGVGEGYAWTPGSGGDGGGVSGELQGHLCPLGPGEDPEPERPREGGLGPGRAVACLLGGTLVACAISPSLP